MVGGWFGLVTLSWVKSMKALLNGLGSARYPEAIFRGDR